MKGLSKAIRVNLLLGACKSFCCCSVCEINARQVANGDNIPSLSDLLSFCSAILGDKASGWLGCAAHGMRDITHEPMQPSEALGTSLR